MLLNAIWKDQFPRPVRDGIIGRAVALSNPNVRELFAQFIPEEKRPQPVEIVPGMS